MKKINLNNNWTLESAKHKFTTDVPASVYSVLLENGIIEDLYFRDNELNVIEWMKDDYTFTRDFQCENISDMHLCFDGIDTVSEIYFNGILIGKTENMHRKYEFDISNYLKENNEIKIKFPAVYNVFTELYEQEKLYTEPCGPLAGAKSLRKSFCMSGWDWAPRLADMGIWKDAYLMDLSTPAINDFEITQEHIDEKVFVKVNAFSTNDEKCQFKIRITSPIGEHQEIENNVLTEVKKPLLWWPNGHGEQYLYTVTMELLYNGNIVDTLIKKIGLRTVKLVREEDKYGESYYHEINGKPIFAMGACYVPEDVLFTKITRERTEKLLDDCLFANFNVLRVWGGGHYPHDFFYELCDEKGILVYQDMMYACSTIPADKNVAQEFYTEVEYNLKRIRHHVCLAVICGNNEMEMWTHPEGIYGERYLEVFEKELPKIANKFCAHIPFVTSSPTSKGGFNSPNHDDYGDQHCWDVWAKNKPYFEYRKHYFRYLSEFGLSAFPDEKTVNSFTLPEDRNVFSRIMEMHQRCCNGNETILKYVAENYKYANNLSDFIYLSQLVQAETVACGIDHQRANKPRSMGALYWQLNDIWPCISFSGIDYYGRYKAVQYFAKRSFAPISVICEENGEIHSRYSVIQQSELFDYSTTADLFVSNETDNAINGELCWELRNASGEILKSEMKTISVKPRSVYKNDLIDFNKTDVNNTYLSYSLIVDGEMISAGTKLFTAPKYFNFLDPSLSYEIDGEYITVKSNAFAKSVYIISDEDMVLSDNFFDLNADSKTIKILSGTCKNIRIKSLYDI